MDDTCQSLSLSGCNVSNEEVKRKKQNLTLEQRLYRAAQIVENSRASKNMPCKCEKCGKEFKGLHRLLLHKSQYCDNSEKIEARRKKKEEEKQARIANENHTGVCRHCGKIYEGVSRYTPEGLKVLTKFVSHETFCLLNPDREKILEKRAKAIRKAYKLKKKLNEKNAKLKKKEDALRRKEKREEQKFMRNDAKIVKKETINGEEILFTEGDI
jgi:hypothetical protein